MTYQPLVINDQLTSRTTDGLGMWQCTDSNVLGSPASLSNSLVLKFACVLWGEEGSNELALGKQRAQQVAQHGASLAGVLLTSDVVPQRKALHMTQGHSILR